MDDSSDFQEKKKCNAGPKKIQKSKVSKPRKPQKRIKGQKDIRALIKSKDSDLVSYSKNFDEVCKKSGVDIDSEQLQLAIALSKSLHDVETKGNEISQDKTPVTSQDRTAKIRLTLQEYGFKVKNCTNSKQIKDQGKRRKFKKQYKLLLVSNEEKQQNISDKYAEVLTTNIYKSPLKNTTLKSNDYNQQRIFNKACNLLYEYMKNDDEFYVHDLFEKPLLKASLLRDWTEIPGRPVSPKKEVSNINFDNIHCIQEELDYILSGSIHSAQNILENKHILNNINNNLDNKNPQEEENNTAINSDVDNNSTKSESYLDIKKEINMESYDILTVTQQARSVSPDLFDDEISLITDDTNNSIKNTQENVSKNVIDYMDLTECVNIVPIVTNKRVSICRKNVTNRTNDLMEITECVASSSRKFCSESIDLTQCILSQTINKYNGTKEILKVDLTQSFCDNDLPVVNVSSIDYEKLFDKTVIINDVAPRGTNKDTILPKDQEILEVYNDNKREENRRSYKDMGSNSLGKITDTNLEFDLSQSFNSDNELYIDRKGKKKKKTLNETNITEGRQKNNSVRKRIQEEKEVYAQSSRQLCLENIDLTETSCILGIRSDKFKNENMEIDLTQYLSPDNDIPEAEVDNNYEKSLETTIIVDHNLIQSHKEKRLQGDQEVVWITEEKKIREEVEINDKQDISSCSYNKDTHTIPINNIDCDRISDSLDKINNSDNLENQNVKLDLTQSTDSENEKENDAVKEKSPIKTISKNKDNEIEPLLIDSEEHLETYEKVECNDNLKQSQEINRSKDYDNYINEDNISYTYDDYVYNNSLHFDYCDNDYLSDEIQDEKSKDDSCKYVNEGASCSYTNKNITILSNEEVKVCFIGEANIKEPGNIDLTENSNPSNEIIETNDKYSYENLNSYAENNEEAKSNNGGTNTEGTVDVDLTQNSDSTSTIILENEDAYNNLGKKDNISIDYDEMFDDVAGVSTKSNSIQSYNISHKSVSYEHPNESSNNSDKNSDFELSDKELNYSMHQSRHNFDIGGLSVLDNVPDFTRSIKESTRQSANLNRSLSDGDLPTVDVRGSKVRTSSVYERSTPILNKDILREAQKIEALGTSNNEYIIKTNNVTPMRDYEAMTSPERNRELEKYGLKPFKRKRAIQILTHLYNQTHPIVQSDEIEECSSPCKKRKLNNKLETYKSPERSMKSPRKLFSNLELEVNKENMMYEITKENPDIKELKCDPEDWVFQTREKAKVPSCKVPLHIAFHNYVSCRQYLREAILRYEPINIDVVHKNLLASGYRYNPKDLLKFMDKKCITVKTADNNARNKKS